MKKSYYSKLLMLCLAFALTASLAACGSKDTSSSAPAESESATESVTEEPEDSSVEAEPEEESAQETTTEEASTETASDLSLEELLGVATETSYVNEHFGFRYDAPDNWYILSREEIATVTGMAASAIDDEALSAAFESAGYVTDLYVMDTVPAIEGADAYNNVNVTIQDIGKLYGIILDEKKLAEASVKSVKDTLGAMGLSDITTEISEMEFLGKTCTISTISSTTGDIDMYQKQVYLKNGAAVACITATTSGEDKTDEVLSAFRGSDEEAAPAEAATSNTDMSGLALSSGAISIDGDLFTLGTGFNEISGEWSLKPEDADKYKDYTLNPRTTSGSAMGVYKEKWGYEFNSFHVMISVVNTSESSIPYLEGDIDYLDIPGINRSEAVPDVILPGGLTLESTEEDFIAAYGDPSHEYEDESTEFKSVSFRDGDVKLDVIWSKGKIDEITIMN